jgi:cyclopropane fatty-acyl-phospholipid synthase-like methyltransferase
MINAVYAPEFFDAPDVETAKKIILTGDTSLSTEQRWATEGDHILDLIASQVKLNAYSTVLDYGCGIGRIARELIDRHHCRVVGVDISNSMRKHAIDYVNRNSFFVMHPSTMPMVGDKWADLVISIWVLQHCARPLVDIENIVFALKPRGALFVVNEQASCVPALNEDGNLHWISHGINIDATLRLLMPDHTVSRMDADIVGKATSERTFWGCYRRND